MADAELQIRALNPEEEAARLSALQLAARLVGGTLPLSVEQVQALFLVIRDDHPDLDEGQIAIGIAFGELIVACGGFEWVRVTDEYGSETSLAPLGIQGACHPISMVQKRIERREDVDIRDLRDRTIDLIQNRVEEGHWAARRGDKSA